MTGDKLYRCPGCNTWQHRARKCPKCGTANPRLAKKAEAPPTWYEIQQAWNNALKERTRARQDFLATLVDRHGHICMSTAEMARIMAEQTGAKVKHNAVRTYLLKDGWVFDRSHKWWEKENGRMKI